MYAERALAEVLPLDDQRRLEMEVWLALSIGSLSDAELRRECAENDAALAGLCRRLMEGVARDVGMSADLAGYEASRLHALVDGLALQLVRQGPEEGCGWATDVVHRHLSV